MRRLLTVLLALLALCGGVIAWTFADAQEDDSADKGRFTRFVEDTISTPDRKITLGSIDGVLSSDVTISSITIADRAGVWLTIEKPHLVWSRLALLRGRLDIDSLTADRITVSRKPLPATTVDPAASPGFSLPELPVSVRVGTLQVPVIDLAAPVLGEAATLSVNGSVSLADGALDAKLALERTDAKPGKLTLAASFANDTRQLDLDLGLQEPEDGVVANLIGIPGRPSVGFAVKGSGPLSNFGADITLATGGEQRVSGRATITETGGAYRFVTDVTAKLAPLVPAAWQPYVAGASTLAIDATRAADGSIRLDRAAVKSGVADLTVAGAFAPDGFPTDLSVKGALADPNGPVPLPAGGTVDRAVLDLAFGGDTGAWTGRFDLAGLDTGGIRAARTTIQGSGEAKDLADPAARRVTFTVTGDLAQLSAADPALSRALGDGFSLDVRGAYAAGAPVTVDIAEIKNPNAAAHFSGTVDGTTLSGRYWLNAADIAPFAGLAGRDLAGAATLEATGTVTAATGALDLTIRSETTDLSIGSAPADALLAGRTTLTGGVARSTEGLRLRDLKVDNARLTARVDGAYDLEAADLTLAAALADVHVLTDRAAGPLSLTASITGEGRRPAVAATLTSDRLVLQGKTLRNARARFDGTVDGAAVDGRLALSGALEDVALTGAARIATDADGTRRIEDLAVSAGPDRLAGTLALRPDGLLDGHVTLDAPDVAAVAPLLLVDAAGSATADVALAVADGGQAATIKATARGLSVEGNRVGSAEVAADIRDLFGVPSVDGRFSVADVAAGGVVVRSAEGTAKVHGGGTDFDVAAELAQGRLSAAGSVAAVDGGVDVTLARLDLVRAPALRAALAAPVTVSVRGQTVRVPEATLTVGEGRVTLHGTVADRLDVAAAVDRLPLSIADAVAPDLGLGGTVSGTLAATGPRADPEATVDLTIAGLTAAPLKRAGLDPLAVSLSGRYAGGTATVKARTSVGGGTVEVSGTAGSSLDLAVRASGLPLALANAAAPTLGAEGSLDATATVRGTPAAPVVDFSARASRVSLAALRSAGVGPLQVAAGGRYADAAVSLSSVTVTGPAGLSIRASGTVPLAGGALDVGVSGSLPLSLADRTLASRGAKLAGTATLDVRVGGPLSAPRATGAVTVNGATFTDPVTTTKVTGIALDVGLDGERATIRRFSARVGGGSIAASGSVGLDPSAGFPVDVTVTLSNAKLTDGKVVTAVLGGTLTARGQATGALAVAGTINVARAEITVPERLPSKATLLDVRHRLPPLNVERTLERARLATAAKSSGAGASGFTLDVTVNAPRAVFVRGRGIDAELGGKVRVTGPVSDLSPVGSLELIRGRLDVIGQRITFTSGRVTLVGDLDPYIDLVATARSSDITVTATISGQASDPTLTLSSVPDLPQDEVLAHFLFGRSLSDLSALQIARLAVAAAQLAGGGGGPDILGQLRNAVGLDDLDVVTDPQGNSAVQAGRYISDNVYLGVTAGANGQSNVSVNLDLTKDLKARAEVGPQSGGKLGLFYEHEY